MGDNFEMESITNVNLIEFDDQQKARIGAALQALVDQIVPSMLDGQLTSNYGVADGKDIDVSGSYVKAIKQENTKIEDQPLIICRNKGEDGIETCISNPPNTNKPLPGTSNDLSNYITQTKDETLLLKFETEPSALDERTLPPCRDDFSKEIEPIEMEDIVDEESELPKNCVDEIFVGDESIDSLGSDSQDKDDNHYVEQKTVGINYDVFVRHICPECGVDCGPYSKWKLHTETQHTIAWLSFISETNLDGDSCFQCLKCKKKLSKKTSFKLLQEHHMKHLPHSYLKCRVCNKRFQVMRYLYNHVKRIHGPDLKFKRSDPYIRYIHIFCPICQQSQSSIEQWHQHLTEKHDYENKIKSEVTQKNQNLYSCNLCWEETSSDYIKIHMLVHEPNKSFQCIFCKMYMTQLKAAIRHIKQHLGNHQTYPYACSYCEATFSKKFLLLKHQNFHGEEASNSKFLLLKNQHSHKNEHTVPWLNKPIKTYLKK